MAIEIANGSYSKGNSIYKVGDTLESKSTPLTYEVKNLYRDTYEHWCNQVELEDQNGLKYNFPLHFVNENFYIIQ